MQQTSNYQLNQWEGADRILRTDFNADNAKIDAAIAELREDLAAAVAACPIVKLMDITAEEDTAQIDLDLSEVDLALYSALLVSIYPGALTPLSISGCIRCNGLTGIYARNDSSATGLMNFSIGAVPQAAQINGHIALLPGGLVGTPLCSHWNYADSYFYTDCLDRSCGTNTVTWSTLQSLNIVVTNKDQVWGSGTRVILRGVKL